MLMKKNKVIGKVLVVKDKFALVNLIYNIDTNKELNALNGLLLINNCKSAGDGFLEKIPLDKDVLILAQIIDSERILLDISDVSLGVVSYKCTTRGCNKQNTIETACQKCNKSVSYKLANTTHDILLSSILSV